MDTALWYRRFAENEARGRSDAWERACLAIADDAVLLSLLDELPWPKRQPNLLLAATRWLDLPVDDTSALLAAVRDRWDDVRAVVESRSTQTNEAGRCAVLLPLLAAIPGPLALIEVGASAGLCLYPDRYRYRYDDRPVFGGDGPVLPCATVGDVPVPDRVPEVVWRAGVDLNPLDVTDADDARWLECLVWPGRPERLRRLRAAVDVARADPPTLVRGDLVSTIADLCAEAPPDATTVVFHSAVLAYVPPADRDRFTAWATAADVRWIANEAPGIVPDPAAVDADTKAGPAFTVSLDGRSVASADPHGAWLRWGAA